ncbi:ATP-binding protein [Sphingomonas sp. RT2P30]|uniref:ATP-binding protein n=1 Tax=Parasphingomonas halimpatiens TaxID=3096162 RepID=UPI002FCB2AB4
MRLRLPRSLLGQVMLLHVAIAAVAAVILPFAVSVMLHRTAAHYEDGILAGTAAAIGDLLLPSGRTTACGAGLPDASSEIRGKDGVAYAVVTATGHVIQQGGKMRGELIATAPRASAPRFFQRGAVEALSMPLGSGDCAWLVVTQDTRAPQFVSDDIVRTFLEQFALLVVPLILLVPAIGAILMWRMTRRLKAVSATAAAIGPRSPDIRLPVAGLPREVEPLALATNHALDRLAAGLRAQGEFAANVAHELRTPLAALRLRIQSLPAAAERDALLAAVDRATRVVTQLMALVDLERPLDGGADFIARAILEGVVIERAPGVFAGGRTIALAEGGTQVARHGHPSLLALAIDNLIDNAVRHTPTGTNITVGVDERGSVWVEDDGPGIPVGDIRLLTQRRWRADSNRGDGAGIGLSIVARIADASGLRLDIASGTDGRGVRFTLTPEDAAPIRMAAAIYPPPVDRKAPTC